MAIMPDEIRDIDQVNVQEQISIMHDYIKYMHEQLEFWGSHRLKELADIQNNINSLSERVADLEGE